MRCNSPERDGAPSPSSSPSAHREGEALVRFVVIGEGRPARTLLDVLVRSSGASIDALVLKDPDTNPLSEFAREHRVGVIDIGRFAQDARTIAGAPGAWLINVNSTTIIPADVLALFEGRSLNFHPGLLPGYAGLHTHQWAIRNGEREFGVTVHRMERKIDTGAIVGELRFPIEPGDTGLSLFSRCLTAGAELFPRIIAQIVRGEALADIPQDLSRRRLYRHRDALDGRIDWTASAQQVVDFVRAGNYEPFISPSYTARLDTVPGFDIEVLRAVPEAAAGGNPGAILDISERGLLVACGNGAIRIVKARRGRKAMTPADWRDYAARLPTLAGRSEAAKGGTTTETLPMDATTVSATQVSIVPSSSNDVRIYTTCPQSKDVDRREYLRRVVEISQWSEEFDCEGMLIYTDNGLVDPWLVAQVVVENTKRLMPLVAVQPIYMHPYAVAKMVASIAHLHGRRIALNMLAGGFRNDLIALGDTTEHDDRYLRTTEYTQIVRRLLEGRGAADLRGKFYSVSNLKMTPPLPAELFPEILISGSSEAGMAAAKAIGATAIRYPQSAEFEEAERAALATGTECGIRVGIIAREDGDEAWRVARVRFPEDRRGQIAHQVAMKVSDSVWHKQLSAASAQESQAGESPYWLGPMQNYKTFCPYLVGSYGRVAAELERYIAMGFRTIILDIPPDRDDLAHTIEVFRRHAVARSQPVTA
ncbi:MAG: LLM class flavin-dependent oxidoreductase [Xanthobacteraceae bacterium]|nr:LLM class flavin-dependent oxidoreductase [Xanthobacteraceae bacterium]